MIAQNGAWHFMGELTDGAHLLFIVFIIKMLLTEIKMDANLAINQKLLDSALNIGGLNTKRETVNMALKEFVQRRKQTEIIELAGTIDFDDDWDPMKVRGKK
jgi:Arc/MetJ family transcription regulator